MHLTFTTNQTPDLVFDYLTDMQKFTSVHPVITKITPAGNHRYIVHETLRVSFLPISFTYPVTVESNRAGNWVGMQATVIGLVMIRMDFTLSTEGGLTTIQEIIGVKAPAALRFIMHVIFKKQHERLFKNIDCLNDHE